MTMIEAVVGAGEMEWSDLSEGRQTAVLGALGVMGRTGWAVWREVEAELVRRDYGAGLAKRAVNDLVGLGWAVKATPKLYLNMRLTLARLTCLGERKFAAIYDEKLAANEWEMLIRGHDGERCERHTLGVLALAWQARARRHRVRLLPGCKRAYSQVGEWVEPDLEIEFFDCGRSIGFVPWEFESRPRGKAEKWGRWAKVVGGWGVATFTAKRRVTLEHELEKAGCRPWLLDLETLLKDGKSEIYVWR